MKIDKNGEKNYQVQLDKAKAICEKQINNLLETVNKNDVGKSEFMYRRKILNDILRPAYNSAPQRKNTKPSNAGTPLSALASKAISTLNFLGNASDCSWLSLSFDYDDKTNIPAYVLDEIKLWIEGVKNKLKHILYDCDSCFYTNAFNNWGDWFIEGCSVMKVDWKSIDKQKISFVNVGASNISLQCEDTGEIQMVAYRYFLSKKEAYNRGLIDIEEKENTIYSDIAKSIMPARSGEDNIKFIDLCVKRTNKDVFPEQLTAPYLRVLINETDRKIVDVQEESTFPYIVSRALSGLFLPYGLSPLWGAVKSFRYFEFLSNAEKNYIAYNADPPLLTSLANSDASSRFRKILPGEVVPALDPASLRPLFQSMIPTGDVSIIDATYSRRMVEIAEQLYANDILPPNANQMSATEVMKRELQWNKRILPFIECRKNDFMAPIVRRCLLMLAEIDNLEPLSDIAMSTLGCTSVIEVIDYLSVQFGGQLLNMSQAQTMIDLLTFVTHLSNMGLGHLIKGREVANKLAEYLNVPLDCIKTEQELQAEQQAIAEAKALEEEQNYNREVELARIKNNSAGNNERGEVDEIGERIF